MTLEAALIPAPPHGGTSARPWSFPGTILACPCNCLSWRVPSPFIFHDCCIACADTQTCRHTGLSVCGNLRYTSYNPLLPPLQHPRQRHPTPNHSHKQRNTHRMQHPNPTDNLTQQTRRKRRQGTATAACTAHKPQRRALQPTVWQEARKGRDCRGVDGPEDEAG